MFILLAGSAGADGVLERMASELRGSDSAPRIWRDRDQSACAASMKPRFVPEDALDAQPLVRDDRVFVCQARIDNREELLRELDLDATVADSTLLAAAYDRWGEACVQRLAGDFAFAVWHRDGHVFGAVDPTGTRRLLWTRIANGIALSAQLAPLVAHPAVSREPDLESLATLLDMGIDRTSTPFRAIAAVPGGHHLLWRGGEPRVERWWNPSAEVKVWYRDPREYVDETRELFTRAVASHLRSSGPVAAALSGGLDSGCVTATAARLIAPSILTAYTSIPENGLAFSERPNWEADDREYAAEVVAPFRNVDHRLVSPAGRCTLEVLRAIHERSLTPSKSATNLVWFDRIAGAGSRVLLVGQHGNAAFSWRGAATVSELATHGRLGAALRQTRREARAQRVSIARVLARSVRQVLPSRRTMADALHPPALRFLRRERSPRARRNEYALVPGTRPYWASVVTTPKHGWWPDSVVQWGVETRDPMTDRRLLERLLQYPQAAFAIGGRHRGLAREVASGLLPDRVRLRTTQGAQVPEAPSLIAAHVDHYRAVLESMRGSAACRELFDFTALERTLAQFVAGERDYHLALGTDRAFGVGLFLAGPQ